MSDDEHRGAVGNMLTTASDFLHEVCGAIKATPANQQNLLAMLQLKATTALALSVLAAVVLDADEHVEDPDAGDDPDEVLEDAAELKDLEDHV